MIGDMKRIECTMKTEIIGAEEETVGKDAGLVAERMRDKTNQSKGRNKTLSSCCRKKSWQS